MGCRKMFLAAGSIASLTAFLAVTPVFNSQVQAQMFFGKVGPANGEKDGNGDPCYGFLDGGGQCLTTNGAANSSDHPVRLVGEVGKSRPRNGFEQFGRRARDLIYIALP